MMSLKKFRKENKISQKELADYLGVGQSFISQIERGVCPLPSKSLGKIQSNPDWTLSLDLAGNSGTKDSDNNKMARDYIEQKGCNIIGKKGGDDCTELLVLRIENKMLREQIEELKSEKAAYWEMIKNFTQK